MNLPIGPPHLFTPAGQQALADLLRQRPLLAFDFDGTLAPIVAHPQDAHLSPGVSGRLAALALRLPVAIVTGRSVADVRTRLNFTPRYIVGNHGAEGLDLPGAADAGTLSQRLDAARLLLRAGQAALAALGVLVEDKGASLALHVRAAPQPLEALAHARRLLDPAGGSGRPWHLFGGKMVLNVVAQGAPDKAAAVHALVARCGAAAALFVGDDVNDEPVFESAPPHWLTLRVRDGSGGGDGAAQHASSARYVLASQAETVLLLQRLLEGLPAPDES